MLTLRLEFLTGRYVATRFTDRNRVEWPPHPARVFSALASTYFEGHATTSECDALRWLEAQPAPRLTFSDASERTLKINYVPVNDRALSDSATLDGAWARVLSAATAKQRDKAESDLRTKYDKAAMRVGKLGKDFAKNVAHVLPSSRTRQPRTYPSCVPENPVVWLSWEVKPEAAVLEGLRSLAAAMVRVGHSSSLVAARWSDDAPEPRWIPEDEGPHMVRWVGPGQLDALAALHAAAPYSEQRVMPYVVANYRPHVVQPQRHSSSFAEELIVFRRLEGPRLSIVDTEAITNAVRLALMKHAPIDPPPPLISGHDPQGGPTQQEHVAIVPLPYVGSRHATGDLLGVGLVVPEGIDREQLQLVQAAVGRWERSSASDGQTRRVCLQLGRLGTWILERMIDRPAQYNLQARAWARESRRWVTVTPMVLDRHPGSIHHGSAAKRARAIARANASIETSCERIGLPIPESIELRIDPFVRGSEPSRMFGRRRGTNDKRPMLHVALTFAERVAGPVVLGAGRYRGLGLMRPMEDAHDG